MSALAHLSDEQLAAATGGCTELSCIYHHEYVAEIRRRRARTVDSHDQATDHG